MEQVVQIVTYIVPMLLSLTVHEYSHARVAYWLGDDTASSQGRLTLNPLAHADPVGTFILPILASLGGGLPLIGWAKPVPVSPQRFTRHVSMHTGMAFTAAAGPLSNVLLMLLSVAAMRILFSIDSSAFLPAMPGESTTTNQSIGQILIVMAYMNAGLTVFNLLPIPPLDGSRLLPRDAQRAIAPIQTISYIVLMGVVIFAGWLIRIPVDWLINGALWLFRFPGAGA